MYELCLSSNGYSMVQDFWHKICYDFEATQFDELLPECYSLYSLGPGGLIHTVLQLFCE